MNRPRNRCPRPSPRTPSHCRWLAHISIKNRKKHIGYYQDEEDAARAYDVEAAKLGRRTNFAPVREPADAAEPASSAGVGRGVSVGV